MKEVLVKTSLTTALKPVIGFLRRQFARRGSELSDLGRIVGVDTELDEAIDVLARDSPSPAGRVSQSLKAVLSQRPDVFATEEARHFIADPRLRDLVKSAARKVFADQDIDEERAQARAIFAAMHGGDGAFGERIFEDGIAFAVKSLASYLGAEDRLLIEALNELRSDALGQFQQIGVQLERIQAELDQQSPLQLGSRIFGVPTPNRQMLPRLELVGRILDALTGVDSAANVVLVGQGGSGKSTVAAMVGRKAEMTEAFPDGIFWLSLGQAPNTAACQSIWLRFVSDRPLTFPNAAAATAFLRAYFEDRRALLIVDDIWSIGHWAPFQVAGPKCRTLITTRERQFDSYGKVIEMTALSPTESIELLQVRGIRAIDDENSLRTLAEVLGHSPLALELAAYQLSVGTSPSELLDTLRDEIQLITELAMPGHEFGADLQVVRNQSLDACLNLSVKRLNPDLRRSFATLSMIRASTSFGVELAARMSGASEKNVGNTLRQLWGMSLLEEVSGEPPTRYRMHSVIRAKATKELAASIGSSYLDSAIGYGIRAYLRRCNANLPDDWHLIRDDGHTLTHLVHYLIKADDKASLRSLLLSRPVREAHSQNHWHRLRQSRNEEDLFGVEIAQIHEYFAARRSMEPLMFDGLARSYIAKASLADMNKAIDVSLCLALLEAGLWTQGQVASHAKRRFSPEHMLTVARRLSEPFRTETLRSAIVFLRGQRPVSETVTELVRSAEVFEGTQRQEIAQAALNLITWALDLPKNDAERNAMSASRLGFLRLALMFRDRLGEGALPAATIHGWAGRFVAELDKVLPFVTGAQIPFHDRGTDTFPSSVAAIEAVLFLALDKALGVSGKAAEIATQLLEHKFAGEPSFAPLRFKLRMHLGADPIQLREAATEAMTRSCDIYAATCTEALWENENLSTLASQIVAHFAQDADFISDMLQADVPSLLATAFFEAALSPASPHRDGLFVQIGDAYGGVAARLLRHGSVAPSGEGQFRLTDDHYRVLSLFLRTGIGTGAITPASAIADLKRLSGDFDRLRLLEAILPSIQDLQRNSALNLCALFINPGCAAIAWLATGARVGFEDRREFLERATALFAESEDSTSALRALSRYVKHYGGEDAVQLAQSATALAAGIGDAEGMRFAFVRASLAMDPAARRECVKAAMWDWWDTMPTHAPLEPIPRDRALANVAYWPLAAAEAGQPFETFVLEYLAEHEPDRTRNQACQQIAEFAQEFAMQRMSGHANLLAAAIFDSAAMYR